MTRNATPVASGIAKRQGAGQPATDISGADGRPQPHQRQRGVLDNPSTPALPNGPAPSKAPSIDRAKTRVGARA